MNILFKLLCVMLAVLPMSQGFIKFELGIVTFTMYTFLVVFLFPFAVFRLLRNPQLFGFKALDVIILLLALTFFQSTILSDTMIVSGRMAFHALFIPIASYFVVKVFITNNKEFFASINVVISSMLVFSVITIYVFVTTHERVEVFGLPSISVATLLVVLLVYSIYVRDAMWVPRILLIPVSLAAFLTAMPRVYMLLTMISPVVLRLLKRHLFMMWLWMIFVTLIITIVFSYLFSNLGLQVNWSGAGNNSVDRLLDFDQYIRAFASRALVYKGAIGEFYDNVVFGTGIKLGELQVTPHNFHVEWLQYGGTVGYFLYSMVFLVHAKSVAAYVKVDRELLVLNLLLFVILVNSLTNGFMHGIMPYVAFLIMGLSESRVNLNKMNARDKIGSCL